MISVPALAATRPPAPAKGHAPLVSIIIPCFNQGQFLPEAVSSALASDYENIEIIVVDDGSSDPKSLAVLDNFSAPKSRLVRQSNRGAAGARNAAIREARGLYILPLDADDRIEPGYLAAAVPLLEADPDLGIVTCNARFFGASDKVWRLPECSLENMLKENCIHISSLFRKKDWEAVGGFDESLRLIFEDYDFWLSILGLGKKALRLEAVMLRYRRHPKSVCATLHRQRFAGGLAARREALERIFVKHVDLYRRHAHISAQCIYNVLRLPRPRHMEIKKGKYLLERALLRALAVVPAMAPFCSRRLERLENKLEYIAMVEKQDER